MADLLRRHPLVSFFALAYAGSWLCWLPMVLARNGVGLVDVEIPTVLLSLLNVVALFAGPFLAAIVMTKACDGRVGPFLRRCFSFRAHWLAWMLALVAVPAVIAVFVVMQPAVVHEAPSNLPAGVPHLAAALVAGVLFLLGGPVQEEPGWRGFALPRLQATLHPAVAALVLGALWPVGTCRSS